MSLFRLCLVVITSTLFACARTASPLEAAARAVPQVQAPTVIYAVRHAEKEESGDQNPVLTAQGQQRALALAIVLHEVELSAVYASTYQRTQLTVAPTAADHGLKLRTDIEGGQPLAAHILATHPHQATLVAGHSNTVPELLTGLGLATPPTIEHGQFGDLWKVSIDAAGAVSVEASRFGD